MICGMCHREKVLVLRGGYKFYICAWCDWMGSATTDFPKRKK